MEQKILSIGQIIKDEVSKQKISVIDFADRISCKRNNVYNIFKRSDISLQQLKIISEVLNRNFFKEIAEDLNLVGVNEMTSDDKMKGYMYAEFLECVPVALKLLKRDASIVIPEPIPGMDFLPDACLANYSFITFTVEDSLEDRFGKSDILEFKKLINKSGQEIEILTNKLFGSVSINVRINHKTQEEWNELMKFVFNVYDKCCDNGNVDRRL